MNKAKRSQTGILSSNREEKMCATSTCDCDKSGEDASKSRLVHPAHIPKIPSLKPDVLYTITSKHKEILEYTTNIASRFTSNEKIQILLRSNQPVHAAALLAICFVSSYLFRSQTAPKPYSTGTAVVYLLCFALKLGSQFWMTFVSGLSLYFTLTRHAFGDVQRILFPRYFTFMAAFSAVNLMAFSMLHSHIDWESKHWIQMSLISTSFILEILARLYIAPEVVRLIDSKKLIEQSEPGVGMEVASHKPGRLQHCPHYMSLHSAFRKNHGFMAITNIISMICTFIQLFYIAGSFSINV